MIMRQLSRKVRKENKMQRPLRLCSFAALRETYVLAILLTCTQLQAQSPYQDVSHYSATFGHAKMYRLYLPEGYTSSSTHYPVIYFFHGWGGRHFKDDNAKLEYEKIKLLVDKYKVILVMWDGNIEESEPRPYNIGNHGDVKFNVQMKDYFPEFVHHVDSTYRTIPDRQHRGIIGFSMGGFMSFFLAGKYPDMVTAAVSLTGSPEFFVGIPNNHTLYPMRYAFKNLKDINIRMHTGDSDILYYLNEEVHEGAKWEGVPIDYYRFHGGHIVDDSGETKVFELAMQFVANAFSIKKAVPERWSHYDLYGNFSLWGYTVTSDKQEPGYIYLKNVSKQGFGVYTHRWLPDGPALSVTPVTVTTAPVYDRNAIYSIVQYSIKSDKITNRIVKSDDNGRLKIQLDGSGYEIGIYKKGDPEDWVVFDYSTGNRNKNHFLQPKRSNMLTLRLFNRGGNNKGEIRIGITTRDSSVAIGKEELTIYPIPGKRMASTTFSPINYSGTPPPHAEPNFIKFDISISKAGRTITDDINVPVWYDVPLFDSIHIDDSKAIRNKSFGKGNANGEANAGEQVVVYQNDHRLRLYTEDPWVVKEEGRVLDEIIPARWPDGFTVSSVIKIDPKCPKGHIIECLASYETKAFNPIERKLTWRIIKIVVK